MKTGCYLIHGLIVLLAFAAVSLPPAFGGPTELVPAVSLRWEYNDNILLSGSNEQEDIITIATGSIQVQRNSERLNAAVGINIDKVMYEDNSGLNDVDKRFSLNGSYWLTERWVADILGIWSKDSIRSSEIDTTGLALTGDSESRDVRLSTRYLISELGRLNLEIGLNARDIQETGEEEKNRQFNVALGYTHNLSKWWPNTTGLLNFSYLAYDSQIHTRETDSLFPVETTREFQSDIWQMTLGVSKQLTALFSMYVQAGIGYTDTREVLIRSGSLSSTDTSNDEVVSGIFLAGVEYRGLYNGAGLSFSHDVRGGAGSNGAVERTSALFNYYHRITDSLTVTFNLSGYLNRNDRTTTADTDKLTLDVQPGFSYRIGREWFFKGGYRFTSIEDRQEDTATHRSLIYVELAKQFIFDID